MRLTREDMLRELELLPVWRLRTPAVVDAAPAFAELPVNPAGERLVEQAGDVFPESVHTLSVSAAETDKVEENVAEPLVQSPWLLLCLQAGDGPSQQLLQNIMQALKLPAESVQLYQQALKVTQAQSRFCILFGLEAANHFLGTSHTEMTALRGQLLKHGEMTYVVTHHPHAMLENALLKKEVWHDLCLLLAEK